MKNEKKKRKKLGSLNTINARKKLT